MPIYAAALRNWRKKSSAMSDSEPDRPWRFQFRLSTLLVIMGLFSVLSAALAGMLRRSQGHSVMTPGFYVIMAAAAPIAGMMLFSLTLAVLRLIARWRRG
jgi:hypothetical protein